MKLHDDPTRWLSTVQIGITSIGLLNGIVGAGRVRRAGGRAGCSAMPACGENAAEIVATAGVVLLITFFTIVFGELVPKRVGQIYPEFVARLVARPMNWISIGDQALRLAALGLHPRCAAGARHRRAHAGQRDRGGNRRPAGGRRGRGGHRGAGAPDGAQRVSPGRPPDRVDDDPAGRDRLARRQRAHEHRAGRDGRPRAFPLPGLSGQPGRRHWRHQRPPPDRADGQGPDAGAGRPHESGGLRARRR